MVILNRLIGLGWARLWMAPGECGILSMAPAGVSAAGAPLIKPTHCWHPIHLPSARLVSIGSFPSRPPPVGFGPVSLMEFNQRFL